MAQLPQQQPSTSARNPMHATSSIQHIVLVLSGKGGVGKSTVACQLAMALATQHKLRVGILDLDICGPSVPRICGVADANVVSTTEGLWRPVPVGGMGEGGVVVMSIAYLLSSATDAVLWRGPRKHAMISQFLGAVEWGTLDYLIIDTPPGTSDEHISICELLRGCELSGAVLVTTPQEVAIDDVRKELSFCAKLNVRCLGIVENMAGYVCPCCGVVTDIFSKGGGQALADSCGVLLLGQIPIDSQLSLAEDHGKAFVSTQKGEAGQSSAASQSAWHELVAKFMKQIQRVEDLKKDTSS